MSTLISRKKFLQSAIVACAAMCVGAPAVLAQSASANTLNLTQEWDKTFPRSNKVDHQKVSFKNRYGITAGGRLVSAEEPQ